MSWLTGYTHRKKITAQTANLDAGLTDFPLYVHIDADADIGALCLASGYDIRFTASDGSTELPYERTSFAVASGEATGHFWVKTSVATSPATELYVYFGKADAEDGNNPTAVWGSDYKGVYHLGESYGTAADNYKDSSAAAHHATLTDADADSGQGDGPCGKCVDLNGDADYLSVADHADHDPGGALTIEAWFKTQNDPAVMHMFPLVRHAPSGYGGGWTLRFVDNIMGNRIILRGEIKTASGLTAAEYYGTPLAQNTWYYAVLVYDKSLGSDRVKVYVDGALVASANGYAEDVSGDSNGIIFGYDDWKKFDGLIDESRYSTVARSAAWIKFQYHNIAEADHELTWGDAETAPVTATPLELELAKATKELAYLLEIELGHRIDTDAWTQCDAPNTAVFWIDHAAEGKPSRAKECDRSAHTIAEYEEADDLADCQATASSWFYDSATGRLYVHTSGGDSPSTAGAYYIASYFWERLCDGQYEGAKAVYYNSTWYLPYLDESSIPDVSLEVSMFSEGGIRQSFGTIHLINTDGHFDQRVADYIYCGKKAVLQVGVPGSALADFVTIWRGWTGNWECTDERLSISTEDERKIAE
jgi:hypothetical protein